MAERLDRSGALDDHAVAGGAREAGHERDRRREDQRARRGDHNDRQRPDGVAADRPREASGDHRRGEKEPGVPVGHPHERRAVRLRLLDQAHERRISALRRGPVGANVKRGAGVRRPAQHRHSRPDRDGQRLAAQRARIDNSLGPDDGPVDRHDLSGSHDHDVARLDPGDGHLLELVADTQLRDLRGALNQRRELTARARRRDVLERRAAGKHQTNDHPGELLPERQSPDHRDQRDRVDTHVMVNDHRATNLERQLGRQQRDRSPPHITGRSVLPGHIQRPADHNRHRSNRREDTRAMLDQPAEGVTNQPEIS